MKLINADCIEAMKAMPDNSVDSIVTDPPYELGFMGKSWDSTGIAFNTDVWREALRVIKPGGHLIAFSGSRTYHRMAVAIEDAGFEIRDQIMYVYGSGFPKSLNVKKAAKDKVCQCDIQWAYGTDTQGTQSQAEHGMRLLPDPDLSQTINDETQSKEVVFTQLQEQGLSIANGSEFEQGIEGRKESSVEGGGNTQKTQGQLQGSALHSLPAGFFADGSQGRLHNGTSVSDGSMDRQDANSNRSGQSQESQSIGQPQRELGALSDQRGSQAGGSWQICGRCEKPVIEGWGTALKPAHEPMVLARKPVVGTVANNVLTYGVGGLNIDGSRVGATQKDVEIQRKRSGGVMGDKINNDIYGGGFKRQPAGNDAGRWPANFIHDGSDEVVELFPNSGTSNRGFTPAESEITGTTTFIANQWKTGAHFGDSGSAARFFYCAKASKRDRNEGLDGFEEKTWKDQGFRDNETTHLSPRAGAGRTSASANHHPTVKPTSLMQYLVRLVTPPNGTVLDPFMGSGSTGKACAYEGFDFIGIEMNPEYIEIAKARIAYAQNNQSE